MFIYNNNNIDLYSKIFNFGDINIVNVKYTLKQRRNYFTLKNTVDL